ncbi:MAG: hypothetical protein ACOC22_01080 [bacterium]
MAEALAALKTAQLSEDEIAMFGEFAKQKSDLVSKAKREADKKAREAERAAAYKKELADHKKTVNEITKNLVSELTLKVEGKKGSVKFETGDDVKTFLKNWMKTHKDDLRVPKKGSSGASANGEASWNKPVKDVTKLKEGTTNKIILDYINKNNGVKQQTIVNHVLKEKNGEMKESTAKLLVSRALLHKLADHVTKKDEKWYKKEAVE